MAQNYSAANHYAAPNPSQTASSPTAITQTSAARTLSAVHSDLLSWPVFHDAPKFGMICVAVLLVVICALFAGLTLAVCGLNGTILDLRTVTGTPKQRQRALVVQGLKKHHTWMLCSLIICSVLCGETLPFIIQGLCRQDTWIPIGISTLVIAFVAEIAPQFFVPRHAIEWGYYCWPLIWGSMWITCIISWPVAKLLDCLFGPYEELIFSNDDLAGLIKYHEKSENNGGFLGPDATRLMVGALSLDNHKIGSNFSPLREPRDSNSLDKSSDVEKADSALSLGMIRDWSAVKTVDIDEPVDKAFIKKVASWSYSRIPVVGNAKVELTEPGMDDANNIRWASKKVFGFLHVKNLIRLDVIDALHPKVGVLVRDLPLYPLPIVMDDMPTYELLNMFDIGVSRMAVVISAPVRRPASEIVIPKKLAKPLHHPTWTGTVRTNARIKSRLTLSNTKSEASHQFVMAVPAGADNKISAQPNVVGIRCPEPVGIITFEDIIDTILQKSSRDETDFYGRSTRPSWGKKSVGYGTVSIIPTVSRFTGSDAIVAASVPGNILRKRTPSTKVHAVPIMDGANERSADTETTPQAKRSRKDYVESSYTQNSRGGFHGHEDLSASVQNSTHSHNEFSPEELAGLVNAVPPKPVDDGGPKPEATSLPTRKTTSPFRAGEWNPYTRRYVSAMPVLPGLPRITPFSRQEFTSYEEGKNDSIQPGNPTLMAEPLTSTAFLDQTTLERDESDLIIPSPSMTANPFGSNRARNLLTPSPANPLYRFSNASGMDLSDSLEFSRLGGGSIYHGVTEDLNSDDEEGVGQDPTVNVEPGVDGVPYDGFPPELLDRAKENQVPKFVSRTMPRLAGMAGGFDGANDLRSSGSGSETNVRESSFHDDRALLPSQRRVLIGSADNNVGGIRSTSFWF